MKVSTQTKSEYIHKTNSRSGEYQHTIFTSSSFYIIINEHPIWKYLVEAEEKETKTDN